MYAATHSLCTRVDYTKVVLVVVMTSTRSALSLLLYVLIFLARYKYRIYVFSYYIRLQFGSVENLISDLKIEYPILKYALGFRNE